MNCSRCGAELIVTDVDRKRMEKTHDGRFRCPGCREWFVVARVADIKEERYVVVPENEIEGQAPELTQEPTQGDES